MGQIFQINIFAVIILKMHYKELLEIFYAVTLSIIFYQCSLIVSSPISYTSTHPPSTHPLFRIQMLLQQAL
jgi:hypothetical protein